MPSITGIAARGPDVAEPEHRGAVGHDRNRVALDRVLEGLVRVVGDRQADARHAGRVDHREVVTGLQRVLVALFDLAADVQQERSVGGVDHLGAGERVDRRDDLLPVVSAGGVHNDVAQAVAAVDLHQVDGADDAAGLADRAGQQPEHALRVVDLDADREAVLRAWGGAH